MAKPVLVLDLDDTLICHKNQTLVKRPGLEAFLEKMAEVYKVVIFSANCAKHVADSVAAFGACSNLISEQYSTKDCTWCSHGFIKDISKFEKVDMRKLVWVDDVKLNFRLCPHNGIEIKPFKADPADRELEILTSILLKLASVQDVTEFLWNGQPKEVTGSNTSSNSKNTNQAKGKKKASRR